MANPIIKIKSSTNAANPTIYNPDTGTGLTFAELGARIVNNAYGLFIGSTDNPIRIGAEVSTATDLGGAAPSLSRIPTQSAVRAYTNFVVNSVNVAIPFVISRTMDGSQIVNGELEFPLTVGNFQGVKTIPWDTVEFTNGVISNLSYDGYIGTYNNSDIFNASIRYDGAFRNISAATLRLNVMYQIAWSQTGNNLEEPATKWQRSQWVERFTKSGIVLTQTGTFGFTTCLINPTLDNVNPNYDAVITSSCDFTLAPQEYFVIKAWNNGGSPTSIITSNDLLPNSATRIQIVGI